MFVKRPFLSSHLKSKRILLVVMDAKAQRKEVASDLAVMGSDLCLELLPIGAYKAKKP